jgi:iron complex outermembrane receptor protein
MAERTGFELEAYAVFGELYWDLTDATRLTLGGRYTRETKEFWIYQRVSGEPTGFFLPTLWGCGNLNSNQQATADAVAADWIANHPNPAFAQSVLTCSDDDGKETWSEFTPRISIDHHFNDSVMAYLSWSRGFRSGGWNGRASTPPNIGPYDPETVDSYEVGLRSTLFDNRLQFNATIFRTEYDDKQESEIFAFGTSTETVVNNAAQATIDGFEIEARFVPTDRLQFRLAVGHTDGEYDEFIATNRLTGMVEDISDTFEFGFAPEWNYNVGIDYLLPIGDLGMLIFNGNYAWADETTGNFGQPDPQGLGRNEFDDRGVSDFSITWDHPQFRIGAFVKDAFHDDNYLATSVDVGVFWFGSVAPGRTWGIELTKDF